MLNTSICIVESQPSHLNIFEVGRWERTTITIALAMAAFIGFVVRGLFIYYLKYEAPKEREINTLMLHDQVSYPIIKLVEKSNVY